MKRNRVLAMVLASLLLPLLVMAAGGGSDKNSRTDRAVAADSSYQTVISRNIFVPDRTVKTSMRIADFVPKFEKPTVPRAEKILTGIAMQGDDPVAFFEDSQTGETTLVAAGGALDDGKITCITFDGVTYCTGKVTRNVQVGETLSGAAASLASADATVPTTPTATSQTATETASGPTPATQTTGGTPPSAGASNENMSIEERMRQRRLKEQ